MTISMRSLIAVTAALLVGCGEWTGVTLHRTGTRDRAVCLKDRGSRLPPAEIQSLRECIAACQARGFVLDDPADLPPAPEPLPPQRALLVPKACEAPGSATIGKVPMPVASSSVIKP